VESLLDEIVHGAMAMLAAALQAEVAADNDAHLGEIDSRMGDFRPRRSSPWAATTLLGTGVKGS